MIRQARTHWLRGNKGERTPRRIMILDTESRVIETEPREVQALRCWVLRVIDRGSEEAPTLTTIEQAGTDPDELAPAIEAAIKSKTAWRLFTHNLSFDLGLTRLPLTLIGRGWQIGRHNLASEQPWAYLKRGSRGLWLCDSWGWLPQQVEKLGELLEIPKLALPAADDSETAWLERCRRDVEITSTALLRLMEEWDRRNLGWWSITGPASGWNTFLHFPARSDKQQETSRAVHSPNPTSHSGSHRVLIVPDPQARAFERQALYSGRRDVWKTGDLGPGPWAEIDLKTAHLSICAQLALPYRRWVAFDSLALDDWRVETESAGALAQCLIRTRTPRYPCRVAGVVLHPVGQFATVLAGPEIKDARERGELVKIGPGYGYHLGSQMQDWARWTLAVLNSSPSDVEPMLQVAAKGWSRSVPGRWGMTHARALDSGPSHVPDWACESVTVGDPPRRGSLFHLAGQWTQYVNDQESDDSFPAVLAYVQSYCRLALNRMLDAIPADWVASCNTEGAWVREGAIGAAGLNWRPDATDLGIPVSLLEVGLAALSEQTAPLRVQLKQTAHRLAVKSPQHIKADDLRLYSGIPRAAQEIERDRFNFQTWPKLKSQIERGDPRGYVRENRTVSLAGVPVSRWNFQSGHCEPVTVCWDAERGNLIQPPTAELLDRYGALRPSQHPALRKVLKQAGP